MEKYEILGKTYYLRDNMWYGSNFCRVTREEEALIIQEIGSAISRKEDILPDPHNVFRRIRYSSLPKITIVDKYPIVNVKETQRSDKVSIENISVRDNVTCGERRVKICRIKCIKRYAGIYMRLEDIKDYVSRGYSLPFIFIYNPFIEDQYNSDDTYLYPRSLLSLYAYKVGKNGRLASERYQIISFLIQNNIMTGAAIKKHLSGLIRLREKSKTKRFSRAINDWKCDIESVDEIINDIKRSEKWTNIYREQCLYFWNSKCSNEKCFTAYDKFCWETDKDGGCNGYCPIS